jgi:hypothetical protein
MTQNKMDRGDEIKEGDHEEEPGGSTQADKMQARSASKHI